MKAQARVGPVDRLIISYNALIAEAEQTIQLLEAGHQYQRNNIIDITAETMATATQTRDTLREGIRLIRQFVGEGA